jgi:hypothetical protein
VLEKQDKPKELIDIYPEELKQSLEKSGVKSFIESILKPFQ